MNENNKYDMALLRKLEGEALSECDMKKLFAMLDHPDGMIPVSIPGGKSYAMGFCSSEAFYKYEDQFLRIKNSIWLELNTTDFDMLTGYHEILGMKIYLK